MTPSRFQCLATFLIGVPAWAQFICVPGTNCSCSDEKVSPNLILTQATKFKGAMFDPSGAPITFERTIVQVRDPKANTVLASRQLNREGRFDIGQLPKGEYRFIAFWQQDGKVRRLPLFDQPKPIACTESAECAVEIVLKLHPTDQPFEFCPPK